MTPCRRRRRILLAKRMTPLPGNQPLVEAIQQHGEAVFGEPVAVGTPLYTDVRLYVERGIPGVIYGAGPAPCWNAKRADERAGGRPPKVIAKGAARPWSQKPADQLPVS